MARVYVAIGGNVEPERWFPVAARELRRRFPGARFSSCYRNPSVDEVLAQCHAIEELCGRRRDDPKWAPRVMDIDLLLYGEQVADTASYRLPRPDLLRRSFMLRPLAEIAGELHHPSSGREIADHWRELSREPHALEPLPIDLNK